MTDTGDRTLTLYAPHGLANRLRMLISGRVIAQASGRHFTLYWPATDACGCTFPKLFQNGWNVKSERAAAQSFMNWSKLNQTKLPDLLASTEPHLAITYYGWLLQPALYPYHAQYLAQCIELFSQLEPTAEIQKRVREFRERFFCAPVIGVHLRRSDFIWAQPDVTNNTNDAIRAVERFLEHAREARILLCTDDGGIDPFLHKPTQREGVREKFVGRFGARVILPEQRSLDRSVYEAVQDALTELWLLRQTDFFVGTANSSFSELAVFGRSVPSVMTSAPQESYMRIERVLRWTRIQPMIDRFSINRFGSVVPVTRMWFNYRRMAQKRIRKLAHWKTEHDRSS